MPVAVSAVPQAQRFVVLDSFRGLCALSVALFHLHIVGGVSEWPLFRSAGLFVEFFFTLSGFVLCHGYVHKAFDGERLRSFLISRVCRIFPLHLVLLLAFTLLELVRLWQTGAGLSSIDWNEWLPNALLLGCQGLAYARAASRLSIELGQPAAHCAIDQVHVFADLANAQALLPNHLHYLQLEGGVKRSAWFFVVHVRPVL